MSLGFNKDNCFENIPQGNKNVKFIIPQSIFSPSVCVYEKDSQHQQATLIVATISDTICIFGPRHDTVGMMTEFFQ